MAIDDEEVDKTRGAVLSIAARIERETDWPTIVSRLCRYCDFLELCEEGSAEYAPADDEPDED
jgi:hypothetical protein